MVLGALLLAARAGTVAAPDAVAPPPLAFAVEIGANDNHFLRQGPVAAHLVLRSGTKPRILLAFPAGNSGVGVWFASTSEPVRFELQGPPQPAHDSDARGRPLYGMTALASIAARDLQIRQAVLSSVRVLRDYEQLGTLAAQLTVAPSVSGNTISWARERLDGAVGYRLTLEITHGELRDGHLRAGADGRIGLRITGLTGETPLTPLAGAQLLSLRAGPDAATRDTLTFLAYREKLLAGSWRFDTYFGRDTLIATRLLLPALSAPAVESALASVLARLSPRGEVAHEEDIGEQAVLDHMKLDGSRSAAPVFDYKMIDSSYLLAPLAAAWLLDDARGRPRAAAFLAAANQTAGQGGAAGGEATRGAALVRNLRFVLSGAASFAAEPGVTHLISLKSGFNVGNWRDSETGLGGGRYPYDVNAVLVPAALRAAGALYASGLLSAYLDANDRASFARAADLARVWRERAPPLFEVVVPAATARGAIESYAAAQGVSAQAALGALGALGTQGLSFHALALDASGAPVPVLHSDEGFALLFGELSPAAVDQAVTASLRPFPAGLMTGVGMVVANPVYAPPALQSTFSRNAYHGTVIWSWQQALFAAGLERQLRRADLPESVRAHLVGAQRTLWSAIEATRAMNNSELWSWSVGADGYQVAPFGASAADADESNAAQLWSTVYLAVRPPPASGSTHE
jgi:hypothetical protein